MKLLLILALLGVGTVTGIQVFDVDDVLGGKGIFSGMKVVVPTFGTAAVGQATSKFSKALETPGVMDAAYANFAAKFKKTPDQAGEGSQGTFKETVLNVFSHNLNAKSGQETFAMGLNAFSDMTLDEVRAKYTGALVPNMTRRDLFEAATPLRTPNGHRLSARAAPDSKNWVTDGHVTKPKNQGGCGSCTDFTVTGALEAHMSLYKGQKGLDLSEQELVDCPTGSGVGRCSGNWPEDIYDYMKTTGQTTEALYKYEGKEGSCRAAGKPHNAKVTNYFKTTRGDENMLKEWVATYGVHSVVIEINDGFKSYKKGVMSQTCSNTRWDHSVLVVGYGTENGQDYWLVKNSWDTNWGDGGYIKMARNKGSLCRIADYAILAQA